MIDNRDEIIRTQLDVIGTLVNNNLRRLGDDLFAPPPQRPASPGRPAAQGPKVEAPKAAAQKKDAEPEAEPETPPEKIEDLKAELNSYIGLAGIKKEVNNLINLVTVYKLRQEHGLKTVDMSLHMVFSGNPGTGKTMIARLMARIYRSLGMLSKGQLIEVDRSGLVAGYVGQTATKTSEVIEKAKGGVLFIDEAYALNSKSENDFGQEAIDTLLKAMEDNREDLVVIVAGYDGLMDEFIHSNPGLESRFNRYLHFDDYTTDEMMGILDMRLQKGQYTLEGDAREAARRYIEDANTSSISFGNGRGVRNLFERLLVAQSNRLAAAENVTTDMLMQITAEDVAAARAEDTKLKEAEERAEQIASAARETVRELEALGALMSTAPEAPTAPTATEAAVAPEADGEEQK